MGQLQAAALQHLARTKHCTALLRKMQEAGAQHAITQHGAVITAADLLQDRAHSRNAARLTMWRMMLDLKG